MTKLVVQTVAILAIIATFCQVVKSQEAKCTTIEHCKKCTRSKTKCDMCEKGYGWTENAEGCFKCPDTCRSCLRGKHKDTGEVMEVCMQCKDITKKPTKEDPRCGATSLQSLSLFGIVALVFAILRN